MVVPRSKHPILLPLHRVLKNRPMDYIELQLHMEPLDDDTRDIAIAQLADLGYESFVDTPDGLMAYIVAQPNIDPTNHAHSLQMPSGVSLRAEWRTIADQNWNAVWESNFDPIVVDERCAVRASFHAPYPHIAHDIVIDPQMSFGTGHHQTTRLMLRALLGTPLNGRRVLDMGCGTGVLAILAEQRGAASVVAIDIEEWAYRNATANVELNNCKRIDVRQGDASLLQDLQVDVVLANINLNVLLADMSAYHQCLTAGGLLLISGILDADVPTIIAHADRIGFTHQRTELLEGWAMVAFERKA